MANNCKTALSSIIVRDSSPFIFAKLETWESRIGFPWNREWGHCGSFEVDHSAKVLRKGKVNSNALIAVAKQLFAYLVPASISLNVMVVVSVYGRQSDRGNTCDSPYAILASVLGFSEWLFFLKSMNYNFQVTLGSSIKKSELEPWIRKQRKSTNQDFVEVTSCFHLR